MDFTSSIQSWFRQNKRDLPWRNTSDPYLIWLSEVILQQTRIEQGLPYYLKFSNRFPTVKELATAPEDEVLSLWQGLGYYSRARNLQAAAQQIMALHDGQFPRSYDKILALKGVGAYTAAAVASIAFGQPHAVVDGNVYRVLSRVFKIDEPIDSTAGKKLFYETAQHLMDATNPGDHNQALMEIGSLVCSPKTPQCPDCPLRSQCLSWADNTIFDYPVKAKKTAVRDRFFHYLVVTDGKKTVLKKRNQKDIWQGLYDFRLVEKQAPDQDIEQLLKEQNAYWVKKDATMTHVLSHQKIHASFWIARVKKLAAEKDEVLVDLNELDSLPMPQLLVRYLQQAGF